MEGHKLQVASAWYGKNVYFRLKGSSGKGTIVAIPEYSQLKEQYKRSIRVLNAYSPDTGQSFYSQYIQSVSDTNGYLLGVSTPINIRVDKTSIQVFNRNAKNMLTDAEGNYIYDLVAIGAYTDQEPDISGAAAWALKEYISEGYGFLIGHDTMYGYGGVTAATYVPNKGDTSTPMYELNTNKNGHWNLNWLMGVNKSYKAATPYEAASLILNIGDWKDKTTLYGDFGGDTTAKLSQLRIAATTAGNPATDVSARCPTNYPYAGKYDNVPFQPGAVFEGGATHSNQQIAYGKVWIDFATNSVNGKLVTDRNSGLTGTNNFYLTTNGNFGMMQIGHSKDNLAAARTDECRILANTILYLSQREPCNVCQSKQGGRKAVHAVTRISSAAELAKIGDPAYWYTYPLDGCYVLTQDIALPAGWKPIESFKGHFNADSHAVTGGKPVFKQAGLLGLNPGGWNLGTNAEKGLNRISSGSTNLTGTARVVGHLNQLFGTASSVDYGGYTVQITGTDGKTYDCITNREGKYAVSNLPCTGKKMPVKVFAPSGAEVTQYGAIYAQVETKAWDSNETVPLHLAAASVRPVPNQTVYEDSDAVFTAGINTEKLPQKTTWQYKAGAGDNWRDVANTTYFDVEYTAPQLVTTPENTYAETKLVIKNTQLALDEMQFRCVFVLDGITYDTDAAKTAAAGGLLSVLEHPCKVTPIADTIVWQGETATFSSTATYYRKLGDGFTARWQYRGAPGMTWENVDGSQILTGYSVTSSTDTNASGGPTTATGYLNRTTLQIGNTGTDISGYQFRVVYEDKEKNRTFTTDSVAAAGKNGQVTVQAKTIRCITHPKNVQAEISGSTAPCTYTYTAEFEYVAQSSAVKVAWEYKVNATDAYKAVSGFPYGGVLSVSTGSPVQVSANTYRVKTVLTLKNPPIALDTGTNHFHFRAKADHGAVAYSGSGDISFNYKIDIIPGTPVAKVAADGTTKIYTYPNLTVFAPEGVRNLRVGFDSAGQASGNVIRSSASLGGITALPSEKGFLYNSSAALSARQVRDYLRQLQFVVSSTVNVEWFIANERSPGDYDIYSGKYLEYIPDQGVTWTQAYDRARSRYNNVLQVQGQLASIWNSAQNHVVHALVGNNTAWLGATSDARYNGGDPYHHLWISGGGLNYNEIGGRWSYPYVQMRPDGGWQTADNTTSISVPVADRIYHSCDNNNPNDWWVDRGWLFAVNLEGSDNRSGYTGLDLSAPGSTGGVDTRIGHSCYMQYGHVYWVYAMLGEYGDSNGNMILQMPFESLYSYWNVGPTVKNYNYVWTGPDSWQIFWAQTNGNGPNYSGVSGQVYPRLAGIGGGQSGGAGKYHPFGSSAQTALQTAELFLQRAKQGRSYRTNPKPYGADASLPRRNSLV